MQDRVKNSELLAKSLGMFIDRVQIESVNINQLEAQKLEQVKEIAKYLVNKDRFLLSPGNETEVNFEENQIKTAEKANTNTNSAELLED